MTQHKRRSEAEVKWSVGGPVFLCLLEVYTSFLFILFFPVSFWCNFCKDCFALRSFGFISSFGVDVFSRKVALLCGSS